MVDSLGSDDGLAGDRNDSVHVHPSSVSAVESQQREFETPSDPVSRFARQPK